MSAGCVDSQQLANTLAISIVNFASCRTYLGTAFTLLPIKLLCSSKVLIIFGRNFKPSEAFNSDQANK